ncbi:MAG: Maf family protein [Myxococcota bacterium]
MPSVSPTLVLASGSPRRRDLLAREGLRFEVLPASIDEARIEGEAPAPMAERLAREKAVAVATGFAPQPRRWVLGADTIVVVDDRVLGKPRDPEHAVDLLTQIVGRAHEVLTGVALCASGRSEACSFVVSSRVHMRPAAIEELREYVATGESLDKAGAYALQGQGRRFVSRVEGSESNVIGLPVEETLACLRRAGALEASR